MVGQNGLSWLHELRATVRSSADSARYRYCRLREMPGSTGDKESWGSVNFLFEVDDARIPVRQIQIYDRAQFTYRFNREHRYTENVRGERFGGGLRTEALSPDEVESGKISHEEFEHAWLTGFLGVRTVDQYRDELLIESYEDAPMLWEAWAIAEKWYPYLSPGSTLILAERSLRELLDRELVSLVDMQVGGETVPAKLVPYESSDVEALLLDRRSWMSPPAVWFQITDKGIGDLKNRGRIRSN
ncbi:MAG: hypothetical protein ABSF84_00495 [Acidimicrobiales bacterium]